MLNRSIRATLARGALYCLLVPQGFGGVIGYWRFEEAPPDTPASLVLDSSPLALNGLPQGFVWYRSDVPAPVIPLTGVPNTRSMEFVGLHSKVFIPAVFPFHAGGPPNVTLEFWLKFNPMSHQSVFWTRFEPGIDANRYNIFVNFNSTFGFDYRRPSGHLAILIGALNSGVFIQPNTWTHLAIVRAGSEYRLYQNCALAASVVDPAPDLPTGGAWYFGGRDNNPFHGFMDEIRLSDAALSPQDLLCATPVLDVRIDIKPGSSPNSINLGSGGTVPVAIFSTASFDARNVDPSTVTLASAPVALKGKGTLMSSTEDVNNDGFPDRVVHVSTEALQLSETDTDAVLEGKTHDGKRIRGADSVRIVP